MKQVFLLCLLFSLTLAVKWAGFRYSPYGPSKSLGYMPSASEWVNYVIKFKGHFSGSTGALILIVGEESSSKYCLFHFPKPSKSYSASYVKYSSKDEFEEVLSKCDSNGIKVWLQVEPGSNDLSELAKIVLDKYGHHSSVAGFGIDLEWWYYANDSSGKAISDSEAKKVVETVCKYSSSYTVFLKHWRDYYMPPSYRDHMIYISDSQDFSSLDKIKSEMNDWAKTFKGTPVMFQIGYDADKSIWQNDPIGFAKSIADAASSYNDQIGIIWVDFTMKYAINK